MAIDSSIFLNKDNIIFFVIFGVVVLIVIAIFFMIIRFIAMLIAKIFKKIFRKKESEINKGADLNIVVNELEKSRSEQVKLVEDRKVATATTGGPKVDYSNYSKPSLKSEPEKSDKEKYDEKEGKDISNSLDKLKGIDSSEEAFLARREEIKIPTAKKFAKDKSIEGKTTEPNEAKAPALKSVSSTAAVAMATASNTSPSVQYSHPDSKDNQASSVQGEKGGKAESPSLEDLSGSAIKIPSAQKSDIEKLKLSLTDESFKKGEDIKKRLKEGKKFSDNTFIRWITKMIRRENAQKELQEKIDKDSVVISSDLHGPKLTYEKDKIAAAKRTMEEKGAGWLGPQGGSEKTNNGAGSFLGSMHETENKKIAESLPGGVNKKAAAQKDASIFGGKSEISRSELRQRLRDPKLDRVEKGVGMDMSPIQRAKLEKEVFSSSLGGNISKADLKQGIRKLNEKLSSAKNSSEHAKLRKEIKFIKKIGGIK